MTRPPKHRKGGYRLELLVFRLRDWIRPPAKILEEAGVRIGMTVLDFGCGPGGFSLAAARMVGPAGRVLAVDCQPLAIRAVQRASAKRDIRNISTILADTIADVPAGKVDMTLLYDVLHAFKEPRPILAEFHRVLKPNGVLSVSDHHMTEPLLLSVVTEIGLFQLSGKNRRTFQFERTGP